jgi:CheY-like chemotaxis protein
VNGITHTILIVDDNDDDVFALQRALKKANTANPQQVVVNGRVALDYLSGAGKYADRGQFPLPFLVFLDLKMPLADGFEVLAWMRQQPALSGIVVVVLTGSDELRDHQRAYALGARSYLVKPPTPADLLQLMQSMVSYWLRESERSPFVRTAVPAEGAPTGVSHAAG